MLSRDKHVTRSGDDYAKAFSQLLPQGLAWPRIATSVLMKVVSGLSQIWGNVEQSASLLLEIDSDPRYTTQLLPEWERAFGLPDPCLSEPTTIGERRFNLVQRMTLLGAQSREFFIALAASIGYTISITEYRPFMVGIDRVGDNRRIGNGSIIYDEFNHIVLNTIGLPVTTLGEYSEYPYMLGPPENRYYWHVHVAAAKLTWFRVTKGQTGIDPHLRIGIATDLECLLRRYKPAHTEIIFDYSGLSVGGSMAGTP
jgi:uncharacterized protein YmfQ (DUF2313 family)